MAPQYKIRKLWWKTRQQYAWTLFPANKVGMPLGFPTFQAAMDYIPKLEELGYLGPYQNTSSGENSEVIDNREP